MPFFVIFKLFPDMHHHIFIIGRNSDNCVNFNLKTNIKPLFYKIKNKEKQGVKYDKNLGIEDNTTTSTINPIIEIKVTQIKKDFAGLVLFGLSRLEVCLYSVIRCQARELGGTDLYNQYITLSTSLNKTIYKLLIKRSKIKNKTNSYSAIY